MKTVRLKIHGGGRLDVHGALAAKRIVIVLSRENFRLDDALVARLTRHFSHQGWTLAKYETRAVETTRLIERAAFLKLPRWLRQGLKAVLLLGFPLRWRHYSPRYRATINSLDYRTRALRELIQWLGPEKEIILLARSAGGRVASLVADAAGVRQIVCLGYPFKHPDEPPEPARYRHLASLRTPMLILQGTRDSYGGIETKGRYRLAPTTRLAWIDTDHGFTVSPAEWERVLGLIDAFVTGGTEAARAEPVLSRP